MKKRVLHIELRVDAEDMPDGAPAIMFLKLEDYPGPDMFDYHLRRFFHDFDLYVKSRDEHAVASPA